MTMNTTTQTEVQVAQVAKDSAELTLRVLADAELIHVGGGYMAADY
jgi:hypothetical protein